MASDLLDTATRSDLNSGLESELQGLDSIFSTDDALEGLSALIEGRRPEYSGACLNSSWRLDPSWGSVVGNSREQYAPKANLWDLYHSCLFVNSLVQPVLHHSLH